MIITAKTSIAQANSGILSSDMPGARVRSTPTMISIAPAMAEISMKPMPSSQKSALMPRRVGRRGERRVHEPAAVRRQPDEQRGEEAQAAHQVGPERIGRQPRERQVARRQHLRQQQHAERLHRRHREQEHHHRAVHGEELVVGLLAEHAVQRQRELRAHDERQHAGEQEEQEGGADVPGADVVVVDDGQAPQAARRMPDALEFLQLARRPLALRREAVVERRVESGFALHRCASRYSATACRSSPPELEVGRHAVAGLDRLASCRSSPSACRGCWAGCRRRACAAGRRG